MLTQSLADGRMTEGFYEGDGRSSVRESRESDNAGQWINLQMGNFLYCAFKGRRVNREVK